MTRLLAALRASIRRTPPPARAAPLPVLYAGRTEPLPERVLTAQWHYTPPRHP